MTNFDAPIFSHRTSKIRTNADAAAADTARDQQETIAALEAQLKAHKAQARIAELQQELAGLQHTKQGAAVATDDSGPLRDSDTLQTLVTALTAQPAVNTAAHPPPPHGGMPPRHGPPYDPLAIRRVEDSDSRRVGGEARLPFRQASIAELAARGELTATQAAETADILQRNSTSKVHPYSHSGGGVAWSGGGGGGGGANDAASHTNGLLEHFHVNSPAVPAVDTNSMYRSLGMMGNTSKDPHVQALSTITDLLAGRTVKESHAARARPKAPPTLEEFIKRILTSGMLAPSLRHTAPVVFEANMQHFLAVLALSTEHSYAQVGQRYHEEVMHRLDTKRLHPEELFNSAAYHHGHFVDSADRDSLAAVTLSLNCASAKGASSNSSPLRGYKATAARNPGDTYCANHGLWFPAAAKHATKTCKNPPPGSKGAPG
jgi:hypothetical protein